MPVFFVLNRSCIFHFINEIDYVKSIVLIHYYTVLLLDEMHAERNEKGCTRPLLICLHSTETICYNINDYLLMWHVAPLN